MQPALLPSRRRRRRRRRRCQSARWLLAQPALLARAWRAQAPLLHPKRRTRTRTRTRTTRTGLPAPAPPPLRGSLSRGSQPHSCPVAGHLRLRQRYGGSGASGCGCAGNRVRGRESCRGSRRDHGRESCRGSRRGRGSSRGRATAHGRGNNRGRASSRGHGSSPRPCRSRPASSLPRVGGRHHENIPWRRRDGPASSQGSGSCCPTGRARDGDCCGTRHRQRARTRRGETCDRPCQAHRPHRAGAFGGQTRTGLRLPCCRRRWCHARRHHGADPLSSEDCVRARRIRRGGRANHARGAQNGTATWRARDQH